MTFRHFIILLFVALLSSCVTEQAAIKSHSQKIPYTHVPIQPGAVARSPDGSHLAVTNDQGLLVLVDVSEPSTVHPVNYEIHGRFPSWHPDRDLLYFGGWMMKSDGTKVQNILSDAAGSMGKWSPDGKKLAVISGTGLYIFDVF